MNTLRLMAAMLAVALGLVLVRGVGASGAELRGRVSDSRGLAVGGAVIALSTGSPLKRVMTLSDREGKYSFGDLQPGVDYELSAQHEWLESRVRTLRVSNPDEKVTINLTIVPPIEFEDITAKAGLDFTLRNGAGGHYYQPEIMTGGVAAIDYNNDGCMDIFFVNGAALPSLVKTGPEYSNRLYRNNCDSTFTDVTESAKVGGEGYSMGVAVGDFDNDGFPDLFVTGVHGNTLYRNRGDGTFEEVTRKAGVGATDPKYGRMWAVSAGWLDYDNDGWLDLFVTNYVAWDPAADAGCRVAGNPIYCHPRVYPGLPNQLFHNNRDGTFTDVSEASGIRKAVGKGMGVAFGDFNGDGLTDIFVANDSTANFLFQNMGDGTFKEVALQTGVAYLGAGNAVAGMGVDFRDFNDDGTDDVAVSAMYFDTFPLFRNRGKPDFFIDDTMASGVAQATHELTGWSLGLFDFDNDGYKDLFLAASHFPGSEPYAHSPAALPNHVLHNSGNGIFDDVSLLAGRDFQRAALYHGAAFADFDNDGRIDVVVTALNSPARLFRNTSSSAAHWIALRLKGVRSNRSGLGAKVRLTLPNGAVKYNHATTSVGYASSSEPLVRFGLGPYDTAREISIQWPSGRVQVISDVRADRIVDVEER
jgi:hypothetical protein